MKLKFIFTILVIFQFFSYIYAQTDTTNVIYDTVVVKEAPLIIHKTVYIPDTTKILISKTWILGLNFAKHLFQQQTKNDYKLSYDDFYTPQIYVGKKIGKTIFTLGFSYKTLNAICLYNGTYTLQGKRNVSIIDTIDVYYKNINGVNTPQYVTEIKNINEYYNYKRDTVISGNVSAKYIDLPIQISYQFQFKNIILSPNVGLTSSFLVNNPSILSENNNIKFQNTYLTANAGFKIGYVISNAFIFGIKGEVNKNVTSVLHNSNVNYFTQTYSVDIQYIF